MFKVTHWIVVSRSHLLTDLLESRWPQEFLVKLLNIQPESFEKKLAVAEASLVVIDLASVDVQLAYQLQKMVEKKANGLKVVFIHFPRQVDARFLINPSVTAGAFYNDMSLEIIGKALIQILRGNNSIPIELVANIDNGYIVEQSDSLTIREREVLQALRCGSTNIDIANQLFVSESTIKTHLYRAFRKIGVSSRGQAIAWAQTHLHMVCQ
ncbi:LuxR C-terminal-related transcriptional regulator [Shewanella benthica]|uniref:LuxR C-terminal-related transcriptional regulator n=1 Tax=Shewanella benthica TaxID=43661 RepID=UPI001879B1E2|nr:LuxR C-terminal-related transcriptional regulator [Shewanella benthica]MBE7215803.1 DNA-binding response regulator [Shewanella benthica]MCL1063344.1 LuxR C-terminal-related transcriptional regulator [Shewanella benthica]